MNNCPFCKIDVQWLVSHVRHKHTEYERELNEVRGKQAFIEHQYLRDKYNLIARKRIEAAKLKKEGKK